MDQQSSPIVRKRKLSETDDLMQVSQDPSSPSDPTSTPDSVLVEGCTQAVAPRRPSSAAWTSLPTEPVWPQQSPTAEAAMVWSHKPAPNSFVSGQQPSCPSSPKRQRTESPPPSSQPSPIEVPRHRLCHGSRRHHRSSRRGAVERATESDLFLDLFPGCPLPFDSANPSIPSLQPPVNRETLKELDLDSILRNPQLRHDLLFDSGLQFRPTSGRRKRDAVENYWRAVLCELESGCTCVSFDYENRPVDTLCACAQLSLPTETPLLAVSSRSRIMTVRMPSRIPPLLAELLSVLLSVIQPLPATSSGYYMQESTSSAEGKQRQAQHHAAQANLLRAALDPDLIEQELQHGLFDPSGLFRVIGDTLKCHCAPMRDRAVEAMVAVAQTCAPGQGGTSADAVRAMRMCFEVLEFMKLDIANHQLQTLRPFLVQSSPEFELKTFQERLGSGGLSLKIARERMNEARRALVFEASTYSAVPVLSNFGTLGRSMQIKIAALKILTDLVFTPSSHTAPTSSHFVGGPPSNGLPETLYLDQNRIHMYATDAADLTALYMFLMLYRQLVFSSPPPAPAPASSSAMASSPPVRRRPLKIEDADLQQVKREIYEIGPSKLGNCFSWAEDGAGGASPPPLPPREGERESKEARDRERWRRKTRDVTLQLAMRADEAQRACWCGADESAPSSPVSPASTPEGGSAAEALAPDVARAMGRGPSEKMVKIAESWAETNLRRGAPLGVLMRNRLRKSVFEAVVTLSMGKGPLPVSAPCATEKATVPAASAASTTGLEPLMPEIRLLAERVEKLAAIHFNVYGRLYETEGFLAP